MARAAKNQSVPDIRITAVALARMREQTARAGKPAIRLSLREAGCSGLEYVMDLADAPADGDYVLAMDGVSVYVDRDSYDLALAGLTIDFQRDAMSSGFVFINPNKRGECGCGVSFSV